MRIVLGGGGGASDERPLNEIYARWTGPHGRLLYWPVALRGIRTFESCFDWISSTFAPLGITDITMWTALGDHQKPELDAFDAVYIGGGNTFSLLAELRESKFDEYLKEFASSGKTVYGGSAGAAVLGRDIQTASAIDRNNVGLTDTTGLNLCQGYAIWPHYSPEQDELIFAFLEQYQHPVLAISERSGIVLEDGRRRGAGFEPALLFDQHGKKEI